MSDYTNYLWQGWIPQGGLTVLAGPTGVGKSTFALDLARRVIAGGPAHDGTPYAGKYGTVVYVHDLAHPSITMPGLTGFIAATKFPPIDNYLRKNRSDLLIVDPISPLSINSFLSRLNDISRETGMAVLLLSQTARAVNINGHARSVIRLSRENNGFTLRLIKSADSINRVCYTEVVALC